MVGEPVLWHAVVVGSGGAVEVGLEDSVPALWCGRVGYPSEVSRGALRVLGLWGPGLWGPALGGAAHEARLLAQSSRIVGRSVGLGIAVVRSRGTAVGVLGVGGQN